MSPFVIIAVTELKKYLFSKETFDDLKLTEYEALKNDIAKHGIKTALHVLPDKTVICGHQRLRAAKELGLKTAPCEIKNLKGDAAIREWAIKDNLLRRQLTPEQRYLLYAKLSKIYEVGRGQHLKEWPRDAQGRAVKPIEDTVSPIGDVLERTAKEVGEKPKTIQRARAYERAIEEMPELKRIDSVVATITEYNRRKELQARESAITPALKNLMLGDALEILKTLPDEYVDCVVTDPPWGINYHATARRWTNPHVTGDTKDIFRYMDTVAKELYRVMKKDSDLYCFCGWQDSYFSFFNSFYSAGFRIANCLVWKKNQRSTGPDFKHRYALFHEFIIYAKKGKRALVRAFSGDVLEFNKEKGAFSPVQKPVPLLEYLISNSTVVGELVIDPFAGTGSTLVAAENLGRNWVGIDKDKKMHDYSRVMIDDAKARISEVRK